MSLLDLLLDGLFAAIAANGFGAISNPPKRAFPRIAILAAVGHALRFFLMKRLDMDIATASVCASVTIGMGSLWLGRSARCPMPVLFIPALLPMIPGIYAYRSVFALVMQLQSLNNPTAALHYMQLFSMNATVTVSVIFMLAAGATLPMFIFKHRAFHLTRKRDTED
ncbi:MAG TPA: threonine/serine exporter family protein, partial [Fibrobacteraceae bacterium]|nr:threonine/serine exporter family protein [Fibrobacteraceae bacterium]